MAIVILPPLHGNGDINESVQNPGFLPFLHFSSGTGHSIRAWQVFPGLDAGRSLKTRESNCTSKPCALCVIIVFLPLMSCGTDKGRQWGKGLTGGFGQRTLPYKYWWTHRFHISIWWNISWAWNLVPRLRKPHAGHTHHLFSLQTLDWVLETPTWSMKRLWKLLSSFCLFVSPSPLLVPRWLHRPSEYREMSWLQLPEIQGQATSPGCHIESYHSYQIIKVQGYHSGELFKNICTWKSLSVANASLLPNF